MNGVCHLHLRNLRSNDKEDNQVVKNKRKIPYGWGFNQITCANYFWEITAWFSFSMLTKMKTCKLSFSLNIIYNSLVILGYRDCLDGNLGKTKAYSLQKAL